MIRGLLRRSPAVAAVLLSSLCAGLLLSFAHALRMPVLPLAIGLVSGALFFYLAGRARRRKRSARGGGRAARPRVLAGGRLLTGSYDLAKDKTTDGQRWLM